MSVRTSHAEVLPCQEQQQQQQLQHDKQLERYRSKLCILYHAATCPYDDGKHSPLQSQCCPLERRCCAAKKLFLHINGCTNGVTCDVPGCKHSRAVWKHYRNCRHNTPAQHAACPICSVVPVPFNPANLCAQFRVEAPRKSSHILYFAHGGDSMAATRGSEHDEQDDADEQLQLSIDRIPRRIPSLSAQKSPAHLSTTTAAAATDSAVPPATTTTLAAKQAAAKLMGSIMDDITISPTLVETLFPIPEQRHQPLDAEKENDTNRTFNQPSDALTTGVSECVIDACSTLLGGNNSNTIGVQPPPLPIVSSSTMPPMTPHHHVSGGRKPNRYYQLEDSSSPASNTKWGGFLSRRRNRSKNEATQPIMIEVNSSSLIIPSDEEDNVVEDEKPKGRPITSSTTSFGRRESNIRRMQRRFLT